MSRLNSVAVIRSARFVEPRTSTKSRDRSTSAPPGCVLQISSQKSQKRGFLLYWPRPTSRMSLPPIPVKGALQFLHRCLPGIILRSRHPRRQMGFSPAMTARHISSTVGSLDTVDLLMSPFLTPGRRVAQGRNDNGRTVELTRRRESKHPPPHQAS